MDWDDSSAFIPHKERCMAGKRLFLNRDATFTNLNSTYSNIVCIKVLFGIFEISEPIEIDLLVGAMIAKNMKLLHGLHFFAVFGFVSHINDLFKTERTCTTNDASNVVFLSDVVQE